MSDRRPVLLTVSGSIPEDLAKQVERGHRPKVDYLVMQRKFDADLVDVDTALATTGRIGKFLQRIAGAGGLLGWYCYRNRRNYEVIVTDGEQVGIPFALFCKVFGRGTARHMMIVHILSVPKKARLVRLARISELIDLYVVYCSWQRTFIEREFGVPISQVVLSSFMVDTSFFDTASLDIPRRRLICSAGLEQRDYATLMDAVEGLDVSVVIAAASPWAKGFDSSAGLSLPANVEIKRLSLFELRELYAAAEFVVMPLVEAEFQAGITTILEAMSMGRAVLCSRTEGQTDTVVEGVTGCYVPVGDAEALRSTIVELLENREQLSAMGAAARQWAVVNADVEKYAERLAGEVKVLQSQRIR